jgi:pilus assembly protein CpaC
MKEGERMHHKDLEPKLSWISLLLLGGLLGLLLTSGPGRHGAAWGQTCSPENKPLVVLLNSATRLQMSSRKPIRTITNPKEGLLTIRTVDRDPTVVVLVGTAPGYTRLEMEDADGFREYRDVLVQADVEYLAAQLRKAVPTANISVIPNGTTTVVLTGYVYRAEDTAVLRAIAQSLGFQVIDGMRLNGVQQVQLDVVVALVERSKGRNFGFNFLANTRQTILGSTVGNLIPTTGVTVGVPASLLQPTQFGQIISSNPGTSNLFGGVIGNASGFLGFLQALETEGVAKLLAQPRLVTLSGNPASFLVGGEQAVPVPAGLGQVGVQFEEFGTRLNFVPVVLGNGRIHLEVEPEVSALNATAGVAIAGATVPGRSTQRVHTTIELETGQSFVIGGLIQRITNNTAVKVPVLGQLPFIGAAFSVKTATETETELVVMVTPHLVDAQSHDQVVKVLPGQETRNPDDFELFLEGILEAPRGPRKVFQGTNYVPAFRNGPTADLFPCAGCDDNIHSQRLPQAPYGGGHVGAPVETPAPLLQAAPVAKQGAGPAKMPEVIPAPKQEVGPAPKLLEAVPAPKQEAVPVKMPPAAAAEPGKSDSSTALEAPAAAAAEGTVQVRMPPPPARPEEPQTGTPKADTPKADAPKADTPEAAKPGPEGNGLFATEAKPAPPAANEKP